ncbi:MAG: aminotransferase [Flavobacteriaceae bacterium]|nr:aminotransferase [Flavobacteriaceae bacterium]MAJ38006.1 aminotransferase [Flavobacteriaceae bacterium]OUX39275.1 MAG: aminotransferase [Flavobacteriaceae bacterium TMED265]OUX39719.1 MAG: aminotransferase [Flavobacteriaceae bacterium TMED265]
MNTAQRLQSVKEYYFSSKLREVKQLITAGKPIINMGIGSPDLRPNQEVLQALVSSLEDQSAHQYQSYQGIPELRTAISAFYQRHYQVSLDADKEILPLMGSKEGIMHISMAYLNKGDKVLVPNPGYPTYSSVSKLLEAEIMAYPLDEKKNWCVDFEWLEQQDMSEVKLMWVNYPNMPTGAKLSADDYKRLVDFAKSHGILLVNDNPYSFIANDEPTSIMKYVQPTDPVLELNSISKTFNMAGWRVGMLVGAADTLQEVLKVKSNMDSGMFYGIQKGAAKALALSTNWFEEQNTVYNKRKDLVCKIADHLSLTYNKDSTGMFIWCKIPSDKTADQIVDQLLYEFDIFIAPGHIFGSQGDRFVRFSLCVPEPKIEEALKRVQSR